MSTYSWLVRKTPANWTQTLPVARPILTFSSYISLSTVGFRFLMGYMITLMSSSIKKPPYRHSSAFPCSFVRCNSRKVRMMILIIVHKVSLVASRQKAWEGSWVAKNLTGSFFLFLASRIDGNRLTNKKRWNIWVGNLVATYSGSRFCPQKLPDSFYKIYNYLFPNANIKNRATRWSARPFSESINTKIIYSLVMLRDICVPKKLHCFG
jgi:hypothetical protein